jgi:hypothetical protein
MGCAVFACAKGGDRLRKETVGALKEANGGYPGSKEWQWMRTDDNLCWAAVFGAVDWRGSALIQAKEA